MSQFRVDVLVVGGGLGGVAAALAAAEGGASVLLTEESPWLGGQLTTQLVPPDEHPWIEMFGATRSYRRLRDEIRDYYRANYPLRERSRALRHLNPGAGGVGPLCHEPKVALAVIEAQLAPWVAAERIVVLREHVPVAADIDDDRVRAVTFDDVQAGGQNTIAADYVLDATETGELLPITGTEFAVGAESRADTGEPNAPEMADPMNMQAVSVCFAISHHEGQDHTIERPADYEHWRSIQPSWWHGPQFGWVAPHPHTLARREYAFTPNPDDDPAAVVADQREDPGSDELWRFRRILARNHLAEGFAGSDISVVNWPMIDYLGGPVFGGDCETNAEHLQAARAQSRSFLYWLQTEAPRADGGHGWPGLRARPDVTGTSDGFAMRPYIRESRRILGQYRITEHDVAVSERAEDTKRYTDSVGIGSYRIDLHPSTGGDNYIDVPSWPFQIPLGALVPRRMRNLIAAGKNISTTHITNGCYRLHPVEWNIGESAGHLAAFCLSEATEPHQVTGSPAAIEHYQRRLKGAGVELDWPDISSY